MPVLRSWLALLLMALAGIVTAEEETAPAVPSVYVEMKPAFVTHLSSNGSPRLSYVKALVTLRVAGEEAQAAVETHMPRLRHELVMLLGEQTSADELQAQPARQALASEAKTRLQAALDQEQTGVELRDVLFTQFVVQS